MMRRHESEIIAHAIQDCDEQYLLLKPDISESSRVGHLALCELYSELAKFRVFGLANRKYAMPGPRVQLNPNRPENARP
jgi:hypothetical protein